MFLYASLPKAAKTQMPSFLKNYAPKLSQNLLQCFRTVWEHPQFNWELIRHIIFGHYMFVKMATGFPAICIQPWPTLGAT